MYYNIISQRKVRRIYPLRSTNILDIKKNIFDAIDLTANQLKNKAYAESLKNLRTFYSEEKISTFQYIIIEENKKPIIIISNIKIISGLCLVINLDKPRAIKRAITWSLFIVGFIGGNILS